MNNKENDMFLNLVLKYETFSSILWYINKICIPLCLPFLIYKVYAKVRLEKKKETLSGKVVLITGASSGLGEALAHCFYEQGCKVILAARRMDELERVKYDLLQKKLNTDAPSVLKLDLENIASFESEVQSIIQDYGSIDILINNGGISNRGTVLDTTTEVDRKIMAINYFGTVALTKVILPHMVKYRSGHIVFISSVQGKIALPERSSYSASKHAIQAFADSLRAEIDHSNIKVSVISPGYINTSLSVNALQSDGSPYGVMDSHTSKGYSAEYAANKIMEAIALGTKDLILSPITPKLAIGLRYFCPSLYFWIMSKRAQH